MKHLKLKSILMSALLMNSITLSSGGREELEALNRVIAEQTVEIQLHRAIAMEIFENYGAPKSRLKEATDSLVLDSTGLSYCTRLQRSSVTATSSPTGIVTKTDAKYETPVRIFIDLLAQLGMHDPTRTWDPSDTLSETPLRRIKPWLPHDDRMHIFDWALAETRSLMAELGEPARVIPGVTIRGGVSVREDIISTAPIVSKMLTHKAAVTSARIDAELRNLFENLLSVKWFARLGPDKAKRATFIALCLDLSIGGVALTDEEFQTNYNFAQTIALAK